jgi:hypothetical protein
MVGFYPSIDSQGTPTDAPDLAHQSYLDVAGARLASLTLHATCCAVPIFSMKGLPAFNKDDDDVVEFWRFSLCFLVLSNKPITKASFYVPPQHAYTPSTLYTYVLLLLDSHHCNLSQIRRILPHTPNLRPIEPKYKWYRNIQDGKNAECRKRPSVTKSMIHGRDE